MKWAKSRFLQAKFQGIRNNPDAYEYHAKHLKGTTWPYLSTLQEAKISVRQRQERCKNKILTDQVNRKIPFVLVRAGQERQPTPNRYYQLNKKQFGSRIFRLKKQTLNNNTFCYPEQRPASGSPEERKQTGHACISYFCSHCHGTATALNAPLVSATRSLPIFNVSQIHDPDQLRKTSKL